MSNVKSYAWEIEKAQFQNGSKSRSRVFLLICNNSIRKTAQNPIFSWLLCVFRNSRFLKNRNGHFIHCKEHKNNLKKPGMEFAKNVVLATVHVIPTSVAQEKLCCIVYVLCLLYFMWFLAFAGQSLPIADKNLFN